MCGGYCVSVLPLLRCWLSFATVLFRPPTATAAGRDGGLPKEEARRYRDAVAAGRRRRRRYGDGGCSRPMAAAVGAAADAGLGVEPGLNAPGSVEYNAILQQLQERRRILVGTEFPNTFLTHLRNINDMSEDDFARWTRGST